MNLAKDLNDPALRTRAMSAARGTTPFDVLIENGRLLDMVTGEDRAVDVGLAGPLIASVHEPDPDARAVKRIDAGGTYILPGFIDTHMHVESSMITPEAYAAHMLPRGVTTVLWDPHELANAAGLDGMDYAIESAANCPMETLPLVPTCVPSAPGFETSGGDFDAHTISDLLSRPETNGSAELMTMHPLISGEERAGQIVNAGLKSGKRVCGHARGLQDGDLAAYVAAGVETDHELVSGGDLLAKLRAGLTIELRGSHEHLLPEFVETLLKLGHLPQTVTLCTDDTFPDDLLEKGGLDRVIRMLIKLGLPAEWTYRAATLNAATRIGRKDLGLIAPGKRANIVLVSSLETAKTRDVLINGKLAADSGSLCEPKTALSAPKALQNTVRVKELNADDFEIPAQGEKARIVTLSKPRFPIWGEREIATRNGYLDLPDDMIRMAIVNRYGAQTPVRVAFLENWGRWSGAYAATVSHDSHNLTVFGRDPEDMALAANRVRDMQGGLAVVRNGEITADLPLPVAGLISEAPLQEIAERLKDVRTAVDDIVVWEPPYLVFKALFGASLVCNAGPRLSDIGIVDPFEKLVLETCVLQ